MNGPLVGSITSPYWIYLIYALGVIGLWCIGQRRWWGWLIMVFVRLGTGITAYLADVSWAVMGALAFLIVDLYCLVTWYRRVEEERTAPLRFVNMITNRYAEGKKEAINDLLRIQQDVEALSGGTFGRRKEDQLLVEYLRIHGEGDVADTLQAKVDQQLKRP